MSDQTQSEQSNSPRHGQERNFRQELTVGNPVTYVGANVGEFTVPSSWSERPVGERFCALCGAWKQQDGILAAILGCPDCDAAW